MDNTYYITISNNPPKLFLNLFEKYNTESICQIHEAVKGVAYLPSPLRTKQSVSGGVMIGGFPFNCHVKMHNKTDGVHRFDFYFGDECILKCFIENREITLVTEQCQNDSICTAEYNGSLVLHNGVLNFPNISNRIGWGFHTEYLVKINGASHRLIAMSYHKENGVIEFEYFNEGELENTNVSILPVDDIDKFFDSPERILKDVKLAYGYHFDVESVLCKKSQSLVSCLLVKDCNEIPMVIIPLSENFVNHQSVQTNGQIRDYQP